MTDNDYHDPYVEIDNITVEEFFVGSVANNVIHHAHCVLCSQFVDVSNHREKGDDQVPIRK